MLPSDPLSEVVNRIEDPTKAKEGLAQRVIKGGFWVFGLNISTRFLRFISTLVLARLLVPSDFGVLGIALLSIALLENFSLTGFDRALIQKKENINGFLNTAWTISIVRAVILFLILFSSASMVAAFFKIRGSEQILRVLALSLILDGVANIGIVFFSKEMDFKRLFIYRASGAVAYMVVAIPLAFILRNIWALAFGILAEKIVCLILSYILHPYRPSLDLDLEKARELYGFGKWLFAIGILAYLITQGDNAFVGRVLGATALGFYAMAYRISTLPLEDIYKTASSVMFPAYSALQGDVTKLREAYLRTLRVVTFITFPVAGMIFVLSYEFTKIFLGQVWLPMVPLIKILSFYGVLSSIGVLTGALFQAIGKPQIDTKFVLYRLVIMALLMYPLASLWGTAGVAVAVVISRIIDPISVFIALGITESKLLPILRELLFPLAGTVTTILVLVTSKAFLMSQYGAYNFLILAVMGFILYFSIAYVFAKALNYQIPILFKKMFLEFVYNSAVHKH